MPNIERQRSGNVTLRGRPKDAAKRDALIAAAREAFFEHGFAATTLESIAARAGVSKVTLYGHFGDKAGLFEAVVNVVTAGMEAAHVADESGGTPLRDRLIAFGDALMGELWDPRLVALERQLPSELVAHPGLNARFFAAGPHYIRGRLAEVIAAAAAEGELCPIADPVAAAGDLYGMWNGFETIEARFGMGAVPDAAARRAKVERAVDVFLSAYAVRSG
jgi:TetR/AcrR family transcriptional regulator, mexJK operon transcriptional repressor